MRKMIKIIKSLCRLSLFLILVVVCINVFVIKSTYKEIKAVEQVVEKYDCILILGAGVKENGLPSKILADRLDCGVQLYNNGCSNAILVSGDSNPNSNEVKAMKEYLVANGVPEDVIIVDGEGFSTYESVYNTKKIMECKGVCIVTQKYHLYRALHIANTLGIDSVGVVADKSKYKNQTFYNTREYAARVKDFVKCLFD